MNERINMQINPDRLTKAQLETLIKIKPDFVNLRILETNNPNKINEGLPSLYQCSEPDPQFLTILQKLLQDENVQLFFDRHGNFRGSRWIHSNGMHHYYTRVAEIAWNAYHKQKSDPLDITIRPSTPHGLESYIGLRILQESGCRVFIIGRSGIPGYWKLFEGIDRNRTPMTFNCLDEASRKVYLDSASTFVSNVQSTYEEAIPDYEKRRLERNKNRIFYLPTIIKRNLKRPSWVVNSYFSWRTMKQLSTNQEAWHRKRYIAFFLQYQPERTSLPEAYGFAVQMNALLALRSCSPEDVCILVKEHPSSFTNLCHPLYRTPSFYRKISRIPGVDFVQPETNTFDFIDSSICSATLTGTVGLESLIRGKPAIFFGVPMVAGIEGQHEYRSPNELARFIKQTCDTELTPEGIASSAQRALRNDIDSVFYDEGNDEFPRNIATWYALMKYLFKNKDMLYSLKS